MKEPPGQRSFRVTLRRGRIGDLAALVALERSHFSTDRISRRSLRYFLASSNASLIVAKYGGALAGYALVLYRPRSKVARLYSIAVAREFQRRGIAGRLMAAAEEKAVRRGRRIMRLEVREDDAGPIAFYEKSGYRLFGRHHEYYGDLAHALRFEKSLDA